MTPEPEAFLPQVAGEAVGRRYIEALGLWESGWRIWAEYVTDMATAFTPEAWMQANSRLLANCIAAPGLAAGEVQRETGLPVPTLNA